MDHSTLIFWMACSAGVVYWVLAVAAYAQTKPEEKSPLLWMDPWWPYHGNCYLPTADKKLFYGRLLFPAQIVLWMLWWYLLRGANAA